LWTAEEIGEHLGGAEALQGNGAFHEVSRLAGGGYWLQATDLWSQYGPAQARRVFEVLRPVLPAGRPSVGPTPNILVDEDPRLAADM